MACEIEVGKMTGKIISGQHVGVEIDLVGVSVGELAMGCVMKVKDIGSEDFLFLQVAGFDNDANVLLEPFTGSFDDYQMRER